MPIPGMPRSVRDLIESRARDRYILVERARQALEKAVDKAGLSGAPPMDQAWQKPTGPRDRLGRKAAQVADAQRRLAEAQAWASIFTRMDEIYPKSTPEGRTADLVFGCGYRIAEVARQDGVDRQTVNNRRAAWVNRCALMAARAGLIDEEVLEE